MKSESHKMPNKSLEPNPIGALGQSRMPVADLVTVRVGSALVVRPLRPPQHETIRCSESGSDSR